MIQRRSFLALPLATCLQAVEDPPWAVSKPDLKVYIPEKPGGADNTNQHFQVVALPDGAFLAIWTQGAGENAPNHRIVSSRSTDQGRTWSTPIEVDGPQPGEARMVGVASWAFPIVAPRLKRVYCVYNKNIGILHSFQNDYAVNQKFGDAASLQFVTGWAYNHNHNFPTRTGTAPMPNVNMFTGEGLFAPRPDLKTAFTYGNRSKAQATQKQAYALFKAGFFADRAFITGGATRTWVASQQYALNPNTLALASYTAISGAKDSYIGSALVKPAKNVSVYYTYSTNANLVSFNPGNGISIPLWSEGKQHEVSARARRIRCVE